MINPELKEQILKMVESRGGVSFVELERIDGFRGDMGFGALDKNVVFWMRISQEAIDAIKELVKENRIVASTTQLLVYMIDGAIPKMPVAKKIPKQGYKKPRWLPLSYSTPRQLGKRRGH